MVYRFAIDVDWNEQGCITGSVPSLHDCSATGINLEEMLDRLEEEVRRTLVARGQSGDSEIELVGCDSVLTLP